VRKSERGWKKIGGMGKGGQRYWKKSLCPPNDKSSVCKTNGRNIAVADGLHHDLSAQILANKRKNTAYSYSK